MNGDGRVPCCQVALCNRLASYRATDGTGTNVYCCAEHLPFIQSMYPPSTPDEVGDAGIGAMVDADLAADPVWASTPDEVDQGQVP